MASKKNWHDRSYKWLLIIPGIVLIASLIFIFSFYQSNGDVIRRDISLKGGTSITVYNQTDLDELEGFLDTNFEDYALREISDLRTGGQKAFIVEVSEDQGVAQNKLEDYLGYELTSDNSSIEFTGSSIGEGFFQQLLRALLTAFIWMALVVFIIFGESNKLKSFSLVMAAIITRLLFSASMLISFFMITLSILGIAASIYFGKERKDHLVTLALLLAFVVSFFYSGTYFFVLLAAIYFLGIFTTSTPSFAVVLAAFADILMTLALVDFLGIRISSAGIVAFLMLIGYSVDSDILLTTKILKRKDDTLNQRAFGAFKTGITMTLTSLSAVIISLLIVMSLSDTLTQLFSVLAIGLGFDLLNTWISNLGILKWYAEKNNIE